MYSEVQIEHEEYEERISLLRQGMSEKGIDLALLFHSTDIYYFSGTGTYSTLAVPLDGEPILLVRIGFERALRDTWLKPENVRRSQGIKSVKNLVLEQVPRAKVIGIEKDVITADFGERLSRLLPQNQFQDVSPIVLEIRMVKSEGELNILRKAGLISMEGFRKCEEVLSEGMTEIELQSEIERVQRQLGSGDVVTGRAMSHTFGVIASGINSSKFSGPFISMSSMGLSNARPFGASKRQMKKGDLVIVDKGTPFQGYHVDEARTYVIGKASDEQRRLFDIIIQMHSACLNAVQPGATTGDVYNAAKKIAIEFDCLEYFMGYGQYGVEYVGHGVGLEMDEPPLVSPYDNRVLKPGMVLAIEPKLMVPGWGGVDIEDTVVVTPHGNEFLTRARRELVETSL